MTSITPEIAIYIVWTLWALSWLLAAAWQSRSQASLGVGREAAYRVVTIVGLVLLFGSRPPWGHGLRLPFEPEISNPLWSVPEAGAWALVGVTVAGFLFCWWARIQLGALWSGSITRKPEHHIVDTGPYGLVRHPIYTGLLTAAFALAILKAAPVALAGAVILTAGYWLKARMEEGFLRRELGAESYESYRKRVPMLVPFLRV
jgi:protein-S-isoprenylcysteine O-methyltransferase Ste14